VAAIADNSDLTSPLLTGDFNGDGKQDIYNGTTHNVFFGNGDGSFQNAVTTNISAQVAGDFNGDGRADLFTSSRVYLGQANGTFVAVPVASSYSPGVLVADFNGDGKTDVFTSDSTLLLGNGHGTFQTPLQVDLTTGTSDAVQNPRYFTGDFNGDGKQDVGVVLDSTSLHASIIVNTYGNGTGVFTNKVVTTVSQSYMQTVPPYVADFNGDGAADIPGFVNPIYTGDKLTLIARTASTLTLAASSNPVDYGSHVTYTATLTTNTNAYSNGGTVNFYDGSTLLGSGTLLQGSATFLPPSLPIPGTHVITAKFVGDDNIKPAGSGPITVQVIHAPIQITWPNPTPISYGTALSATQLNATAVQVIGGAPVPGTFVYTPAAGTSLGVGSHTLNVDFTPTDTVAYANIGTLSVGVTVNKATPSVAITQIAPASPGATIGVSATLQAAVTVSYGTPTGTVIFYDGTTQIASVIVSGGVATTSVTFSSAGTHAITAVYQGDGNFTTATSAIFNEVVTKATPAVTWSTPAAITYGTALSLTQLNATSTVAGTFVYSPAVGAVLGTGSQTLSVTFTPTDTATYNNATATTTLTVNKATPPIAWPTPTTITFGTALSAAQLNAASSVAVDSEQGNALDHVVNTSSPLLWNSTVGNAVERNQPGSRHLRLLSSRGHRSRGRFADAFSVIHSHRHDDLQRQHHHDDVDREQSDAVDYLANAGCHYLRHGALCNTIECDQHRSGHIRLLSYSGHGPGGGFADALDHFHSDRHR
ncbi:MAG: Ig-like domain repeat protein, partial [Acidobacteria bacterium]|nr:Ig-like domain repeat protein [Acidobacteriota bacterium]